MSTTHMYSLTQFKSIYSNGFDYTVPTETYDIIMGLTSSVGQSEPIIRPVFRKKSVEEIEASSKNNFKVCILTTKKNTDEVNSEKQYQNNKRKKNNKNMEVSGEEWESIRSFQTTKFEEKVGVDAYINQIKSYINKLTDKTFIDMKDNICKVIETMMAENHSQEDINKLGTTIFEIASNNRFYSKLYADLYSNLITSYVFLKPSLDANFSSYRKVFDNIEYIQPEVNYDKYCEINKANDKRKAVSQFFVNMAINGLIDKLEIVRILKELLEKVLILIEEENKKNEVDEIIENVAILYNSSIIENNDQLEDDEYTIDDETVHDVIRNLANADVKEYKSLTKKTTFKLMDLIEE